MNDELNNGIIIALGTIVVSLLGFLAIGSIVHFRIRRRLGIPPEPAAVRRLVASSSCKEVMNWLREDPAHLQVIERCSCTNPNAHDGSRCEYTITLSGASDFEWQIALERNPGVFDQDRLLTVVFLDRKYQRYGYRRSDRRSR